MKTLDTAIVLARVLTIGVVMSIEKNDKELPGLERILAKHSGRASAILVNSKTAAVHTALAGQGIGHGDAAVLPDMDGHTRLFVQWLGIEPRSGTTPGAVPAFDLVEVAPDRVSDLGPDCSASRAATIVVDLTGLGFGPAGAVLTDDQAIWDRGERLKIFGAFDLRTMWTQRETAAGGVAGVQFNYRLSPLVAACLRMALLQSFPRAQADPHAETARRAQMTTRGPW